MMLYTPKIVDVKNDYNCLKHLGIEKWKLD